MSYLALVEDGDVERTEVLQRQQRRDADAKGRVLQCRMTPNASLALSKAALKTRVPRATSVGSRLFLLLLLENHHFIRNWPYMLGSPGSTLVAICFVAVFGVTPFRASLSGLTTFLDS